jgi:rubrerythrin
MAREANLVKRREELAKVFEMAIRGERYSQQMYEQAISSCDDPDWRYLLEGLRDDEKRHEKELINLYRQLQALLDLQEAEAPARRRPVAKTATKRRRSNAH